MAASPPFSLPCWSAASPWEAPVSSYLAEQVEGIASLDFQRALTISTAAAWGVWLLFVALAVYMVKKSSGKPRPKRV